MLARKAFPDLHTTIERVVASGEMVATHWRSVGTHQGPFYDLPITNRAVEITGMTFSRLAGDRIGEEWESWDHADLIASLGVVNLWEA
jgi:predicted ester cyclase